MPEPRPPRETPDGQVLVLPYGETPVVEGSPVILVRPVIDRLELYLLVDVTASMANEVTELGTSLAAALSEIACSPGDDPIAEHCFAEVLSVRVYNLPPDEDESL